MGVDSQEFAELAEQCDYTVESEAEESCDEEYLEQQKEVLGEESAEYLELVEKCSLEAF